MAMAMTDAGKKKRRRRWIIFAILLAIVAIGAFRFMGMRKEDLTAWPAPATGVSLAPDMSKYSGLSLISPSTATGFLARVARPSDALLAEYRKFQALGLSAATGPYPLIEARLGDGATNLVSYLDIIGSHHGLDPSAGAFVYNEFVDASSEFTVLGCYYATAFTNGPLPFGTSARVALIEGNMKLMSGGGLFARSVGLSNIMLVVREIIMNPGKFIDNGDFADMQWRLHKLESETGDIGDALRADYISVNEVAASIYSQLAGQSAPAKDRRRRLGGMSGIMVGLLGGNKADTDAHLSALFSKLVENSMRETGRTNGLASGLPGWVAGERKSRPPWTRDTIGSALASSYMKNAVYAHNVAPSLLLELRAARLAMALEFYRQTNGVYPEDVDALFGSGLLAPADILDPFAERNGDMLKYSRDGEGWRFYSAGLNRIDNGGIVDAYRVQDAKQQKDADFVFISRERESRAAPYIAAVHGKSGGRATQQEAGK